MSRSSCNKERQGSLFGFSLHSALVPQAIFEVISSEHSYLHSLEILVRMFKNSAELSEAMTKTEHHHLFSNIVDVCEASTK